MNENKEYLLESDFTEAEIKEYDSDLEDFDLDDFSKNLEEQIELDMQALGDLEESSKIFKSSESVLETIAQSVSDQFNSRIAAMAGENFIKDNNGLKLDLRDSAHIQTAENFEKGILATHNHKSINQLEKNYDRYKNTSHKEFREKYVNPGMDKTLKRAGKLNKEGVETVTDIYTGRQISTQTKLENGKNNPKAAQREHVNPSAELYKNTTLQMGSTNEELAGTINDPNNLQGYTTADRNNRKSDKTSDEMDAKDKTKRYEKAKKKSDEFVEEKENKIKEKLEKEGKETQKEETKKIGKATLKAVLFKLLKNLGEELLKNIIAWFKSAQKTLKTLLETIKTSLKNFIFDFKKNLKDAVSTSFNTIMTSIYGPIYRLVMSSWNFFKQGFTAVKKVYQYLKNEENKNKSSEEIMVGVSEIILTAVSGAGAIVLGEFFEKKLMLIPGFAIEIPLLGSIASIIGIFLGAIISGVLGALVINRIKQYIDKVLERENTGVQLELLDRVRKNQEIDLEIKKLTLEETQYSTYENIHARHSLAKEEIKEGLGKIKENLKSDETIDENLNEIDRLLGNI